MLCFKCNDLICTFKWFKFNLDILILKVINVTISKLKEVSKPFPVYDEYLATPNKYPILIKMRAFESFSWDELNGGHVSIIKDR